MTGVWVTADTITAARMNEKTIFQGSGSDINGLTAYPGMTVFCTSTGSGFTINTTYIRNATNDAWITELTSLDASKVTTGTMDVARIGSGTLPEVRGGTNQSTYAQGDIIYASATDTLAKLPKGTDGQFLKIGATIPSWSSFSNQNDTLNPPSDDSTTSTTYVVTSLSLTLANRTGGKYLAIATLPVTNNNTSYYTNVNLSDDGSELVRASVKVTSIDNVEQTTLVWTGSLDGSVLACYFKSADVSVTSTIRSGGSGGTHAVLSVLEI